jgi:hypothetical protein
MSKPAPISCVDGKPFGVGSAGERVEDALRLCPEDVSDEAGHSEGWVSFLR